MSIFNSEDVSINNVLSAGSSVKGDMKISGFMRIDGDLDGDLETTGAVIIGAKARVRGNITARSITVSGVVLGDITAPDAVHLLSSSTVIGDVQTHRFRADENVVFHGHCISIVDTENYERAASVWRDREAIASKAFMNLKGREWK